MTTKCSGTGVALNTPKNPTDIWTKARLTEEFLSEVDRYFRMKVRGTSCIFVDFEEAIQDYTADVCEKNKLNHRLNADGSESADYPRLSPSLYALFAYNYMQNTWLKNTKDGNFRARWVPKDLSQLSPSIQKRIRKDVNITTTLKVIQLKGGNSNSFSPNAHANVETDVDIEFYDPTENSVLDNMIQAEDDQAAEDYLQYSHQAMIDSLGKMAADLTKRGNPFRGVDEGIDAVLNPEITISDLSSDLGISAASARRVRSRSRKTLEHGAYLHKEGLRILRKLAAGAPIGGDADPVLVQHLIDGLLVNEDRDGNITITGYGRIKSRLPMEPENMRQWLPSCWLQED